MNSQWQTRATPVTMRSSPPQRTDSVSQPSLQLLLPGLEGSELVFECFDAGMK